MKVEKRRENITEKRKYPLFIDRLELYPRKKLKKFISADLETFYYKNRQYVYSIGFLYEGNYYKDFFLVDRLKDNDTPEEIIIKSHQMVKDFIIFLLQTNKLQKIPKVGVDKNGKELKGYWEYYPPVYFHNLGRFDGIFLLSALTEDPKIDSLPEITSRDGNIYQIVYKGVPFRDSLKIFPSSIEKLSKDFLMGQSKGKVEIIRCDELSLKNLLPFKKSYKSYMRNDIELLYLIIIAGQKYFYNLFETIDITESLTLPSAAFKIFRNEFYFSSPISKLNDQQDAFIRKAYFGGAVDVFIPKGDNLFYYDVNSLYPFAMTKMMPVGSPTWVQYKNNSKKSLEDGEFGFFKCKIRYFGDLIAPLLPVKNKMGTFFPKGEWTGIYFSEEIRKAILLGYEIEILYGYTFKGELVFNEYVEKLYNMRLRSQKPAINYICKLLLNSLYGRFGMKRDCNVTQILTAKEYIDVDKFHGISNEFELSNNMFMTTFSSSLTSDIDLIKEQLSDKEYNKKIIAEKIKSDSLNIAVQISAAITSYARIYMHDFKNIQKNPCFYSDTDSVVLQRPLGKKHVSKYELGKFKLEMSEGKGVFLGPKIYCMENNTDKPIFKFKGYSGDKLDYNWFIKKYEDIKNVTFKFRRISEFLKSLAPPKIFTRSSDIEISFKLNKRERIFNKKGDWVSTKPIVYIEEVKDTENTKHKVRITDLKERYQIFVNKIFKKLRWKYKEK